MKPSRKWGVLAPPLVAAVVATTGLMLLARDGHAVQAPRISLDMITAGNVYDEATNTMTIGPIENCSTSPPPGNSARHLHIVHIILQDTEDMVGWQVRFNYDGGRMRPSAVNFEPFADTSRGQNVSLTNLPIDPASGVHRGLVTPVNIPPAAPGAQSAFVGAVYSGPQTAPISPDTPAKSPPDDNSYSAPGGGVLAALTLQVLPGQAGQAVLAMDLDDDSPNPPGSALQVFTGSGLQAIAPPENMLADGFHAEGSACVPPAGITPVTGEDPGLPDTSTPEGGARDTPGPGATSPADGTGPGGTATDGASPGEETTGSSTPDGQNSGTDGKDDGGGNGDGTSAWVYVLVAIVIALAGAGAFAAWRFRSRLPWLGR